MSVVRRVGDYFAEVFWSDEDECFVANLPDFKYCSAFGDTPEEAVAELGIAQKLWLEVADESGERRPEPHFSPNS